MKAKYQSLKRQITSQITGSIDESVVEIVTGITNRGAAASSAAENSPSFHIDVLTESERDKVSTTTGHKDGPVIFRSAGVADR